MSIKKKSVFLFIMRLARAAISVITLSVSAKFFGVTVGRDSWIIAYTALVTFDMMIWGAVNETFRTKFIQLSELEGKAQAITKTNSLFVFTNVLTVFIFIFLLLAAPLVAKILAPTFTGEHQEQLVNMIRFLAPSLMINQVNSLMTGILNAYEVFFIPEIAGFITGIINIFVIVFGFQYLGIYSLVWGYYISLLILLGFLIYNIRKKDIPLLAGKKIFNWESVKVFLLFALPYYVPYFFGQVNALAEKTIASMVGRSTVSILDYSRKVVEMPAGVIVGVLSTMLVPSLSKSFINRKSEEYNKLFAEFFQLGLLFYTLFVGFLILGSHDLVQLLYGQGNISEDALGKIENLVIAYSFAFVSIFFYQLLSFILLSSNKGKIAAIFGIIPQILMIVLSFFLFKNFDVWVFPFSSFIAHLIIGFVYLKFYPFSIESNRFYYQYFGYFLIFLLLILGFRLYLKPFFNMGNLGNIVLYIIVVAIMFLPTAYLFRLKELSVIKKTFRIK